MFDSFNRYEINNKNLITINYKSMKFFIYGNINRVKTKKNPNIRKMILNNRNLT